MTTSQQLPIEVLQYVYGTDYASLAMDQESPQKFVVLGDTYYRVGLWPMDIDETLNFRSWPFDASLQCQFPGVFPENGDSTRQDTRAETRLDRV